LAAFEKKKHISELLEDPFATLYLGACASFFLHEVERLKV
jgi:hypothetical protein